MNFLYLREGWRVSFLEADCKTSLRKKLVFAFPEKIIDLAKRGGADFTSASRADIDYAINIGRGEHMAESHSGAVPTPSLTQESFCLTSSRALPHSIPGSSKARTTLHPASVRREILRHR